MSAGARVPQALLVAFRQQPILSQHALRASGVEINDGDVRRVRRQPTEVIGIGGRDDRPADNVRRCDEERVDG